MHCVKIFLCVNNLHLELCLPIIKTVCNIGIFSFSNGIATKISNKLVRIDHLSYDYKFIQEIDQKYYLRIRLMMIAQVELFVDHYFFIPPGALRGPFNDVIIHLNNCLIHPSGGPLCAVTSSMYDVQALCGLLQPLCIMYRHYVGSYVLYV